MQRTMQEVFVADDGQIFLTEEACVHHERDVDLHSLPTIYGDMDGCRISAVDVFLWFTECLNPVEQRKFADILNNARAVARAVAEKENGT